LASTAKLMVAHLRSPVLRGIFLSAHLFLAASFLASAQSPPSEWHDDLLDHLLGRWDMNGTVLGRDAHHALEAEWILNHQFLRIHEKTRADAPKSEQPYDALWFLGYDSVSDRYVLHLLDTFGARYSETLGYGIRDGNSIRFVFEYPDGPFHTAFLWSPADDSWRWKLEQKDKDGKWAPFADFHLTRARS
jgi:hypothetical protein